MGRTIDADAAIAAVKLGITRATLINITTGEKTYPFDAILIASKNEELQKAVERIKKLPTVEPRRGRWIVLSKDWDGALVECSECGYTDSARYPFCHECGARME